MQNYLVIGIPLITFDFLNNEKVGSKSNNIDLGKKKIFNIKNA